MCHTDKGIWVSQKAPGGFDTVIEVTTEVQLVISVSCLTVAEQDTVKRSSRVTPHHTVKTQVWIDMRHFPPYVIFFLGGILVGVWKS